MTIDQIKLKIFQHMDTLQNENAKLFDDIFTKTVKGTRKSVYIDFYYTIVNNGLQNNIIYCESSRSEQRNV